MICTKCGGHYHPFAIQEECGVCPGCIAMFQDDPDDDFDEDDDDFDEDNDDSDLELHEEEETPDFGELKRFEDEGE